MRGTLVGIGLAAATGVHAEEMRPATLAGHAVLPAMTLVLPPEDAPRDAWVSGKFTGEVRNDRPYSVPIRSGLSLPFIGQPVQGFSGLAAERAPDGSYYVLTDNGFGAKSNSGDALLAFRRIAPDWGDGSVEVLETVWLRDPDRVVPFRLVNEATEARYLTGGDFDPESIQVVGGEVWIGDEFGPFLIRATLDGRVTGVFETRFDGEVVRSPDHPALRIPAEAGTDWRAQRSGGYEGMALNPETGRLWALLEKPLVGEGGLPEGDFLRMLEFDPATGSWTGETRRFPLGAGASAIGDVNFIDATRALVIERDGGEGDPSLACPDPETPEPGCFPSPARVKRVVLADIAAPGGDGMVGRLASIDLMAIDDPDGVARVETAAAEPLGARFTFPFTTIEAVVRVDDDHILVGNDNNLPFSTGRAPGRTADNEFILLSVPELLAAGRPPG
jgi:hypothetical protein